ncbi:hypothetical protein PWT90_02596 [Aphanocladium album]|nr:hypothetical protein PWT90_02596 [Aphanocladium album]
MYIALGLRSLSSWPRSDTLTEFENAGCQKRLDKLEAVVQRLVNRLDPILSSPPAEVDSEEACQRFQTRSDFARSEVCAGSDDSFHPPPVFLSLDAGVEMSTTMPHYAALDPISTGLVSLESVKTLLSLIRLHYGRLIRLSQDMPVDRLRLYVRRSPLLLCSVLLIAVRHTTDQLAEKITPRLLEQVRRWLGSELLIVPQPGHFFQAVIVVSLWSITIGQAPLGIDSWDHHELCSSTGACQPTVFGCLSREPGTCDR